MLATSLRPVVGGALVLLAAMAGSAGTAAADGNLKGCPDDGGGFPDRCTKEIRIYNNTDGPLWAILQASIQRTDAIRCTVNDKGGGDVWLQAALEDYNKCYAVKNDYYVYVNPTDGIAKGSSVSLSVPWWSKRTDGAQDPYIDWWRGARVIFFDDQNALNDTYAKLKNNPEVAFAAGSPKVKCNDGTPCKLQIFEVNPGAGIDTQTPYQLNEFTFADVRKVTDGGTKGGDILSYNQGYNVSNVDQLYLPLAIEPVRDPPDEIGYMGTTISVPLFRKQLAKFAGYDEKDNSKPLLWPIYNNPTVKNKTMYPKAGIRIPSTQTVFNFYMNPQYFPGTDLPKILPFDKRNPDNDPPELVVNLIKQWKACTANKAVGCPSSEIYKEINDTFLANYKKYINTCDKVPNYLKPVTQNPPAPKFIPFLTYVYGWVPFNFGCANEELPTADQPPDGSRVPIDYMSVQYNYEDSSLDRTKWFNPYTQLVHDSFPAGGLAANAYAFSIDDHSSFQSNDGGKLPGGLIFAIGGANGLPSKKQVPPPVPPFFKYFDFSINLGTPGKGKPYWLSYGICSDTANSTFPFGAERGYGIGVDPALTKITRANPCNITLVDSEKRKYRIQILQADAPPNPIWPPFKRDGFDPNVIACPDLDGFVPPEKWCVFINETADPSVHPGQYGISTRVPLEEPRGARR
jgi:hypothetical protein